MLALAGCGPSPAARWEAAQAKFEAARRGACELAKRPGESSVVLSVPKLANCVRELDEAIAAFEAAQAAGVNDAAFAQAHADAKAQRERAQGMLEQVRTIERDANRRAAEEGTPSL